MVYVGHNEVSMKFYLSHGLFPYGAVHYYAVSGTPEEEKWLHGNASVKYVVAWNPVERIAEGGFALNNNDRLEFAGPMEKFARVRVKVAGSVRIRFYGVGDVSVSGGAVSPRDGEIEISKISGGVVDVSSSRGMNGWLYCNLTEKRQGEPFVVEAARCDSPVHVLGFDTEKDGTLNWAWDKGIKVKYVPGQSFVWPKIERESLREEKAIVFDSDDLCPGLGKKLAILSDSGSTVLAEVR